MAHKRRSRQKVLVIEDKVAYVQLFDLARSALQRKWPLCNLRVFL